MPIACTQDVFCALAQAAAAQHRCALALPTARLAKIRREKQERTRLVYGVACAGQCDDKLQLFTHYHTASLLAMFCCIDGSLWTAGQCSIHMPTGALAHCKRSSRATKWRVTLSYASQCIHSQPVATSTSLCKQCIHWQHSSVVSTQTVATVTPTALLRCITAKTVSCVHTDVLTAHTALACVLLLYSTATPLWLMAAVNWRCIA
eukprot:17667-Heterococcus_DN1.PRE.1